MSGMGDSVSREQVIKYLSEDDNFKEIYFEMKKRAIPRYVLDCKGKTTIGIPLTGDEPTDRERRFADLLSFDQQSIIHAMDCVPCLYDCWNLVGLPRWDWRAYSLLDIGSRTGGGGTSSVNCLPRSIGSTQ